jgi:hypothetical protein
MEDFSLIYPLDIPFWVRNGACERLFQNIEDKDRAKNIAEFKEKYEKWKDNFLIDLDLDEEIFPEVSEIYDNINLEKAFISDQDIFYNSLVASTEGIKRVKKFAHAYNTNNGKFREIFKTQVIKGSKRLVTNLEHYIQNEVLSMYDSRILKRMKSFLLPVMQGARAKPEHLLTYGRGSVKGNIFRYLKDADLVADSDSHLVKESRIILEKVSQFCEERDLIVSEYRTEMLNKGPIYIKPTHGGQAFRVMRVEKINDGVDVFSEDPVVHQLIRLSNSKTVDQLILNNLISEEDEAFEKTYSDVEGLYKGFVLHHFFDNVELKEENLPRGNVLLGAFDDLHKIVDLKGGEVKAISNTQTRILNLTVEKIINALEGVYTSSLTNSYAESQLHPLKINNKIWETRVIVQDPNFEKPDVTAMYCKLGNGDIVANISTGGEGISVYELLKGKFNQDEISQFETTLKEKALEVTSLIGEYLSSERHLFGIPNKFYRATDVALDFILTQEKQIKLVDINFQYGISGLQDESAKEKILENKYIIKQKTKDYLRNLNEQGIDRFLSVLFMEK